MKKTIFEELLEGLDLTEEKELKGFSRYLIDIEQGRVFDKIKGEYKKNTPNAKGYVYHRLRNDKEESITLSMHSIVMAAALECKIGWWKRLNLVVDHRNGDTEQNNFANLQLITQSENLLKRKSFAKRSPFTNDEIELLHSEFEKLADIKHGELMDAYANIAEQFSSAVHTIQAKYLAYKNQTNT